MERRVMMGEGKQNNKTKKLNLKTRNWKRDLKQEPVLELDLDIHLKEKRNKIKQNKTKQNTPSRGNSVDFFMCLCV